MKNVVVVGSQIKGASITGALPVTVISSEDIDLLGVEDGTELLEKVDNFEELQWTLEQIHSKFIFWSRDKSPKFFEKLKEGRPDLFKDWIVHDEKINIIYPNNEQYVFYLPKLPQEWWKNGTYGSINEVLR